MQLLAQSGGAGVGVDQAPPPGTRCPPCLCRAGYRLKWGGAGDSAEANSGSASTLPMRLARVPILIGHLLIVPLALIDVLGLLATDTALEFMTILDVSSLSGLLIKNAIVVVDQMEFEMAAGKRCSDAAANRLRSVAMGTLPTVLGEAPLFADAFFRPQGGGAGLRPRLRC